MRKERTVLLPKLASILKEMGENIKLARLRRKLTAEQVAERAGISRSTLWQVENGFPGTSFGIYAQVLHVLGLENDLLSIAKDDELGRKLQDADLRTGLRAPKK